MTALEQLTAVEAVQAMSGGEVGPAEYLAALLSRIADTEKEVEAWEYVDHEGAMAAARELEARRGDARDRALYGLPLGIKDVINVQGQPTRAGFAPYFDHVAGEDSGIAARSRDAAAVMVGKTVSTQFAWSVDPPKTRNPWNPDHTPGGSSSGSVAAVAARQVPVAIGTQTTSSLLRPAAYCGVVAFKPTYGRISCYGVLPTGWSSDQPGIASRSVADTALVFDALAGYDARDPHSADVAFEKTSSHLARATSPRLGRVRELFEAAQHSVRVVADRAVGQLEQSGATIDDAVLPADLSLLLAVHWIIQNSESAAIHFEQFRRESEHYAPSVRANLEVSELVPAAAYLHARRWKRRLRPAMMALLEGFDVLIAPTSADRPPRLDAGDIPGPLGDMSFQVPWTCFGFPNITIPLEVDDNNLPHAVQLIGRPFHDLQLLQAASWCEEQLPFLSSPIP